MTRKKPTAIVSDIDGTLYRDDKTLSESTVESIAKFCADFDVKFYLASSRMPKSVRFVLQEFNISHGFVAYDGAYYFDCTSGESQSCKFDIQLFDKLDNAGFLDDLYLSIFVDDTWVASHDCNWLSREVAATGVRPDEVSRGTIYSFLRNKEPIHKFMARGDEDVIAKFITFFRTNTINSKCHSNKMNTAEVTPADVSKLHGISRLLNLPDSSLLPIVYFGDGENDREALKGSVWSVAMGNASEKTKSCAHYITDTNNNGGIEKALDLIRKTAFLN